MYPQPASAELAQANRLKRLRHRLHRWLHTQQRRRQCLYAIRHLQSRNYSRQSYRISCHLTQQLAIAMSAAAVMSAHDAARTARLTRFDTDSELVGMDNRASACISHIESDFKPGTLRPCNRVVRGFGGQLFRNVLIGTLIWRVEDDLGHTHVLSIPGSYYVPQGGVRLFSPQHFAQTRARPGARQITDGQNMVLTWATPMGNHTMTCPIDPAINVASFPLASGYTAFEAFAMEAGLHNDLDPLVMPAHLIPPDDEDDFLASVDRPNSLLLREDAGSPQSPYFLTPGAIPVDAADGDPLITPFDLSEDDLTTEGQVDPDEEDLLKAPLPARLLRIHHCHNHISFAKLRQMARRGIIPKALADCDVPICSACLYGKATKRPWRTKAQKKPKPAKKPGDVVSVDQMTSPTPGLIAQMAGFLTKKRYKHATMFVDQASGFGYVYLQKTTSAEETLEAKTAFEKAAAAHGVKVKHYHADNGVFASEAWRDACTKLGQGLSLLE